MTTKICANCGFENEADDVFCVNCGQRFDESRASNAPEKRRPRRFPLGLAILAVILLVAVGTLSWFLTSGRISNPIQQDKRPQAASQPDGAEAFLVLISPGDTAPQVLITDIDGNLIREVGPVTSLNEAVWLFENRGNMVASWRTGTGAGAWAWPNEQVALVALGTQQGIDLLSVDVARDGITELAHAANDLRIHGIATRPIFAWSQRQSDGDAVLYASSLQEEQAVQFAEDPNLSLVGLSPDGKHLVYQTQFGFVASTDGSYVHQLGQMEFLRGAYSPDGQTLFYSTGYQIVRSKADGSDGRIITEIGRRDTIYPISVGEEYLVAFQQIESRRSLKVMSWKGEITAQIKCPADGNCMAFQLPNKQGLSIVTFLNNGGFETELANSDGSERVKLASGRESTPTILADQRHLVLDNINNNTLEILLYDMRKKKSQVIDQGVDRFRYLASNERYLIYSAAFDNDWSLMAADLGNGDVWELDSGAPSGYPAAYFMPDGKSIIYEARSDMGTQEITDTDGNYFGSVQYPDADIYRVELKNPDPKRIYPEAGLLAASLVR